MSQFDQVTTLGGSTITLTNEDRFVGDIVVRRYRIITTNLWIYEALEPRTTHSTFMSIDRPDGKHSLTTVEGTRRYDYFGAIGTQGLPEHIASMSTRFEHIEARIYACKAHWLREATRAHKAIMQAFPEAEYGTRRGTQIELTA